MTQTSTQLPGSPAFDYRGERRRRPRRYELPEDASPEEIREKVRTDVEDRLIDLCSNWPTGEFDRIVLEVTETTLKINGINHDHRVRAPGSQGS